MIVFLFFLPAILVLLAGLHLYSRVRDIKVRKIRAYAQPFPASFKEILHKYFLYYKQLPAAKKHKFEKRIQKVMINKHFVPMEMPIVTDEMRVLVSAAIVQITFGLPEMYLQHFSVIQLYPSKFLSGHTGKMHLGEVNPMGIITLSWEHFIKGYINPTDGYNLALHELAHAIRIENIIRNGEYGFFDRMTIKALNRISFKELNKIRQNTDIGFLREYAAVDPEEFFAVSIESFFERPKKMKEKLPELYNGIKKLLNQDPLRLSVV